MNLLRLDHLALSAETLDAGRAHVEHALGVDMGARGAHPQMGTHNRLLSLGPDLYFEAIAIDPGTPPPDHARWFDLDRFAGPPRLTNWILATQDLDAALNRLPAGFGPPLSLQRGAFRWSMAVPDTGVLPWGGWAPALIQWHGEQHPAPALPDQGIRLGSLVLHHPDAADMAATLAPLLPRDTVLFEQADTPGMTASFDTPHGRRVLS